MKAFFLRGVHIIGVPLHSHDTNVKWDTVSGLQSNLAYHSLGFWDIPLKKAVEKALKLHAFGNPNGAEGFTQGIGLQRITVPVMRDAFSKWSP